MDNDISASLAPIKKSRFERWSKNGIYLGFIIAMLDLTGWRGDIYNGNAASSIGHIVGTVIGSVIIFGILSLLFTALVFIKHKLTRLFR